MIEDGRAVIIHDSFCILDVSQHLCEMFRCAPQDLIDRSIIDLLATDELKGLGRLRMVTLRRIGHVRPIDYVFRRLDGSVFVAHAVTERYSHDGIYQSILTYRFEGY